MRRWRSPPVDLGDHPVRGAGHDADHHGWHVHGEQGRRAGSFALPDGYVRPRDDEHVPGWLREQVELAAGLMPEGPESEAAPGPEVQPARQQHNLAQQKELLDQLTVCLLGALPADWQRLVSGYRVVGRRSTAGVGLVKDDDLGIHDWDPPIEAWHRLQDQPHWYRAGLAETDPRHCP